MWFPLFVLPRRSFFHRMEGKRGCFLLGEKSRRRLVLPVPARPRRLAVRRPVPTRPGYARVLDSTGLHMNSLVRASEESFRTVVFALGDNRVACFLGGPTRRRPVGPGPARPAHPAVRRPAATRPWYVRVFESTGLSYKPRTPP